MKKCFLRVCASLCCCILAMTGFTACEDNNTDNPADNFVYYRADGNISGSGSMDVAEIAFWLPEYNVALSTEFPNTGEENDDKAIAICDEVYNSHKANKIFSNASGEVTLYKYRGLSSDPNAEPKPEKTLKVYVYDGK